VNVYAVLVASELVGVNVTDIRSLLRLIEPETGCPPAVSVIDMPPTLAALIAALKTTSTRAFTGTPVRPLLGLTLATVGAVMLAPDPAVKLLVYTVRAWPSMSVIPFVALIV